MVNSKINQPECNTYFWGNTEDDYVTTIKALFKMNSKLLGESEEELITRAKIHYSLKDGDFSGFTVYPYYQLLSRIGDLEYRFEKKGDF